MYYGWVEDRIRVLAKSRWRFFGELPWCLVTCIDGSRDVKGAMEGKGLAGWEGVCSVLGHGLVVGEGKILEVARAYELFNGFDEIWLFEARPTVEKPRGISIVPPPADLTAVAPPQELREWIEASGCVLGLGDGIGMNYITTSREIAEALTERQR